jgi:hypothetical protein
MAIAYFFDPERGRWRRSRVRDGVAGAGSRVRDGVADAGGQVQSKVNRLIHRDSKTGEVSIDRAGITEIREELAETINRASA